MAIIKDNNNKILERMWQNRNSYTLLVGMQISTTTMDHYGKSIEIPQKTTNRTSI
jgi:hypothetical protein